MKREKNRPKKHLTEKLSVRLAAEDYALIEAAAKREGLQTSSFAIMIFVRANVLPPESLNNIKRLPVPCFNELHALLGTINLIGGNCKQLALALPDIAGLRSAHASIIRAADAVMEAIQGKPLPYGVNLYKLEGRLTTIGYSFNDIVRSVNMGRPQLSGLRSVLTDIAGTADAITAALTGRTMQNADMAYVKNLAERAREDVRASMKKSAKEQTKPRKSKI